MATTFVGTKPSATQPAASGKSSLPMIGFVLLFVYLQVVALLDAQTVSCTDAQALIEQTFDFADAHELTRLLVGIDAIDNGENHLSSNFAASRGFVLRFNLDGLPRLANSAYAFAAPLIERMRDPLATAFVLNAVLMPLELGDASSRAKPSIGMHLDDTVSIDSARSFVAHSVSVLYLAMPAAMRGGELELFKFGRGEAVGDAEEADATVAPKAGMLAIFRLPPDCLPIASSLPSDYLLIAFRLPPNCLPIICRHARHLPR